MGARDPIATDSYLDELLSRRAGARPTDHPAGTSTHLSAATTDLLPSIRQTADLLDRAMPRFHPSFRFEERLAGRLRTEATGRGTLTTPGELVAFPGVDAMSDEGDTGDRRGRSLLVGGAIASGVSIAGAALLAWRRGRGPDVTSSVSGERAV
ncbi:MAG: amidoligase family protein [Chloroflexota bacterium]|nr:amidoligase family protein [Chloroflexota bacterium]